MNAISIGRSVTEPIHVASLSGSPSPRSRSSYLSELAQSRLREVHPSIRVTTIRIRDLPAVPLLLGDGAHPQVHQAIEAVVTAQVVLVATPVYKAAYSGLLKLFVDVLPIDALRGKIVVPIVTGGSNAHLLALDYALKPLLSTLGAREILDGIFASDAELAPHDALGFVPDATVVARLDQSLQGVRDRIAVGTGAMPAPARCS